MLTLQDVWDDLPTAWGGPAGNGNLRTKPEDFQVIEEPITLPSGEGEHLWLRIKKRSCNTDWVANQLARLAGLKQSAVSYAGMKDRHAVTTQWFSLHLPGKPDPVWPNLEDEDFEILESRRHNRKLKRGGLKSNQFQLLIRDITGDQNHIDHRIETIRNSGVPNYFGNQRFGRGGQNLNFALKLFSDKRFRASRTRRGIYLSAARSAIFNKILAARIESGNWNTPVVGEACQLDGRSACFVIDALDEEIVSRANALTIHPTAALWGEGEYLPAGSAKQIELDVAEQLSVYTQGLESNRMAFARRAMRIALPEIEHEWVSDTMCRLQFSLPPGSYATAVLREIINANDVFSVKQP